MPEMQGNPGAKVACLGWGQLQGGAKMHCVGREKVILRLGDSFPLEGGGARPKGLCDRVPTSERGPH